MHDEVSVSPPSDDRKPIELLTATEMLGAFSLSHSLVVGHSVAIVFMLSPFVSHKIQFKQHLYKQNQVIGAMLKESCLPSVCTKP